MLTLVLLLSVVCLDTHREDVKELDISYDWTYTTDYKGTLQRLTRDDLQFSQSAATDGKSAVVSVEPTQERIDMEKLKVREPILWFEDVALYEDELHDHGVSAMSIKMVPCYTCAVIYDMYMPRNLTFAVPGLFRCSA